MSRKVVAVLALVAAFSGCTLYKDVSVMPLLLTPASIDRGADLASMLRKADYLRAIDLATSIDARDDASAADLAAIGNAYLASGRLDEARVRLRAALDLRPFRSTYADIAWDLSQVEFLANNFESAYEWAQIAGEHGLQIREWHLEYLKALSNVAVYRFPAAQSERVSFRFGRPDVPRIETRLNGVKVVEGVIDSGAVLSIVSNRLAASLPVRRIGDFEGTFFGLLGEPIPVTFGMLDTLQIGDLVVENVPVAIMPDEKMRFLVGERDAEFHMDFLLGTNLLKEFRIDLNFDRRHVTFKRLTQLDRRPAADQNLFYEGFRPLVRGAVNRKGWFLFILDTGSEITFLNEARLRALPVQTFGSGAHSATLQGLGGAMKHGAKLENVEVGIDRWAGVFKTIPMYESEDARQAVGIIGQNFLGNFNVVIDFGRMRVDLERR